MAEFVMPKLGADMTAGLLVAWRKKPGDVVRRGDVVAEVETDKGVIDVEIFTSGTIDTLLVQEGQKVPVGTVLAMVREEGAASAPSVTPALAPWPAPTVAPSPTPMVVMGDAQRLRISPAARALAQQLQVDPTTLQGTGPGGAITREDIEKAATPKQPAPPTPAVPPVREQAARMRQAIAAAMSRSKREIPHYYLSTTIDMHRAMKWLSEENARRSVTERLLSGVLLVKAAALALRQVPEMNAVWESDQVKLLPAIHVGVAISLRQGGLIAPALHDTDTQSLDQLMQNFRDLVTRTRAGALRGSELADATITVTSLGEQGVEAVYGIINPPQVAIVGFGKVVERPWVVDGQVVPRQVLTATLAADHRVSDGHRGGLYLTAVERLLQEPEKL